MAFQTVEEAIQDIRAGHMIVVCGDEEGTGVLLYLQQEGRGLGRRNQPKAYVLQDDGCDTVQAHEALGVKPDLRPYGMGAHMLRALGIGRMRLITNHPRQIVGLAGYGLQIVDRVPIEVPSWRAHLRYSHTTQEELGHPLK